MSERGTIEVKRRADLMGLELSEKDAEIIEQKWQLTPFSSLEDLLNSLRRLNAESRSLLINRWESRKIVAGGQK